MNLFQEDIKFKQSRDLTWVQDLIYETLLCNMIFLPTEYSQLQYSMLPKKILLNIPYFLPK